MFSNYQKVIKLMSSTDLDWKAIAVKVAMRHPEIFLACATEDYPDVITCIKQDKKVLAIKAYIDATGLGIRESKECVENLARDIGHEWKYHRV